MTNGGQEVLKHARGERGRVSTVEMAPAAGGTNFREGLGHEASTTEGLKTEGPEGRQLDTDTPLPPTAEEWAVATFRNPDLGHGWLSPPGALNEWGCVHCLPLATLGPKPAVWAQTHTHGAVRAWVRTLATHRSHPEILASVWVHVRFK